MLLEIFYLMLALAILLLLARPKQKHATPEPLAVQVKTSINPAETLRNEEIIVPYEKSIDLPKAPEIAPCPIKRTSITQKLSTTEKHPSPPSEPVYTIKRIKKQTPADSKDTPLKSSLPTPESNKENALSSFLLQETEKYLSSLGSSPPSINTRKMILNPSASPFSLSSV